MAILVVAIFCIVLSIPMILGKVPPNGLYGFRTPKTLSSPKIWYPANRISGIYLAIAGVAMIAAEGVLFAFGYRPENSVWLPPVIILVPTVAALIASFRALSRLT